jgi:RNA polymerase sigma-70 factor (ECF subfamily)
VHQAELRLSRIETLWTLVRRANEGTALAATDAQAKVLDRYGGAVRRYLLGALHDPEAADDLFQEFAVRFLHGDLHGANPQRGRFRFYLKGVLSHLVADYQKRQKRQPRSLPADHPGPAVAPPATTDSDREFFAGWRAELLARAWDGLARLERRTGQPFHAVLRFRAENPRMRSPELAEHLGRQLGRGLTAAGVRQTLHRAREKFAELLLDEVRQSLDDPTDEELQDELLDLGLLDYCRAALERRSLCA